MKEIPMLFSTPMVQAIHADRKTQTRRIIKPQPYQTESGMWRWGGTRPKAMRATGAISSNVSPDKWGSIFPSPYGRIGDRLWVRETWAKQLYGKFIYRADCQEWEKADYTATGVWRPSIHMPRAACRLRLQITDVRVERLQDISEEDAIAEGVLIAGKNLYNGSIYKDYTGESLHEFGWSSACRSFQSLWQSINSPESWDENPWVWVIEFEKINEA